MPGKPKELRPVASVGGRNVQLTRVELHWQAGLAGSAKVSWTDPSMPALARGAEVKIADGSGRQLFTGLVQNDSAHVEIGRRSFALNAREAGFELERPHSIAMADITRSAALNRLVKSGNCAIQGDSGGDKHDQLILLGRPPLALAHRLAMLGGRILLFDSSGARVVDPCSAKGVVEVKSYTSLDHTTGSGGAIRTVGRDPSDPSGVLTGTAGKGGAWPLTLVMGEAVSAAELSSAAGCAAALLSAPSFVVRGGPDMLAIQPGTWIRVPDVPSLADPVLVTSRRLIWSGENGWEVDLSGEAPPCLDDCGAPPRQEPAKILRFEEKCSSLRVSLLDHPGVEMLVRLRADTASKSRAVMGLPAAGEVGMVGLLSGHTMGIYLGSGVPNDVINSHQWDTLVAIERAGKHARTFDNQGAEQTTVSKSDQKTDGAVTQVANGFSFDQG